MILRELIERLALSKEPDYDVDLDIMKYYGFCDESCFRNGIHYTTPGYTFPLTITNFTGSVDCAIKLLPKGFNILRIENKNNNWKCEVINENNRMWEGSHKILSVAILLAIFGIKKDEG
ncbi:MAG: hypothetical protein H7836_07980 [Magnetococcus sp. YQC-3]